MSLKVVIVGGVAGGASTAARLRRLSEEAEIVLLERGDYISYANCGLPYYIGGIIEERDDLFVMTPQKFKEWLNVDVRVKNEALRIDRANKEIVVINHKSGEEYRESYDYLVLSPGAEPLRPPLPGIDSAGIFSLRSVRDMDRIYEYLANKNPRRAVVVGAGFIGLEMAENLKHRGLDTTIVELTPQVLPPIDADMAAAVQQYLRIMDIKLRLGDGVKHFVPIDQDSLKVELNSGETLETDLVILSIGVKPETGLAREAGLEVEHGIRVNERMQTSDPAIYALGDAAEITNLVTGKPAVIPLAGPANKQGRIVADNIAGRNAVFKGAQGTSVLKIFDMTVAATGANERSLQAAGIDYHKVIIHPNSHAGYYPGATPLTLKLIFSSEGAILGAQASGFSGVEKRIDVIASVLRAGGKVEDLQELELSYAPPHSSAKDPVNMAGFVAGNILNGDFQIIEAEKLITGNNEHSKNNGHIQILDVREPEENELGSIPASLNIPLGQLRERLHELDRQKEIVTYCSVGLRSYLAYRILVQNGFATVRGLNGGYRIYQAIHNEAEANRSAQVDNKEVRDMHESNPPAGGTGSTAPEAITTNPAAISAVPGAGSADPAAVPVTPVESIKLDLCGLQCPGPIMQIFRKINEIPDGAVLEVRATDPGFTTDIVSWCRRTGNTLLDKGHDGKGFTARIRKGNGEAHDAAAIASTAPAPAVAENDKTIVVFSGDLDRALAALIIANGAAAMGRRVTLFFTFWGLNILRKNENVAVKKPFLDGMFSKMMPRGSKKLGLSRMNMAGMGPKMIRMVMKNKNVDSLETLIQQAINEGIRLVACRMSMDIMGISEEELLEGVEYAGVGSYLDAAESSDVNLFI